MKSKFYKKVLSNGMTLVFEKRDVPVVSVGFAVRFGGINEDASEKGIAHFIEHMLYKGTPSRDAKQIAQEIEKNGGHMNGLTDESLTMYYCKMPSKHLNVALDVLSDMIKNPKFDQKELEKERKVIFEEMKMRRDQPDIYVFDKIQSFLYEAPLGLDLIGDEKTMGAIDRNKILAKFKEIYSPNNLILCVVGDADFDFLVNYCEKNFGEEKGSVPQFKIVQKNDEMIEKRKGLDQANLVFAFHSPLSGDKKSYAAKILGVLMGGGLSSRLFSEIREKRNLAYAVKAETSTNKDYSFSLVYVGTTKENVAEVKRLIVEEYKKVSEDLDDKELNEVKEQILGNYNLGMEDSEIQMFNLIGSGIDGDAKDFYEFEKRIKEVKLQDVKDIAKSATAKNSFFALIPED